MSQPTHTPQTPNSAHLDLEVEPVGEDEPEGRGSGEIGAGLDLFRGPGVVGEHRALGGAGLAGGGDAGVVEVVDLVFCCLGVVGVDVSVCLVYA